MLTSGEKQLYYFPFYGMNGAIQEFLNLFPFFCGIKQLAAVINGTGFRSDIALLPQAFEHAGQRGHGIAEVAVDCRQGGPVLTVTENVLQNMGLHSGQRGRDMD